MWYSFVVGSGSSYGVVPGDDASLAGGECVL